jgi:hypothetical protein
MSTPERSTKQAASVRRSLTATEYEALHMRMQKLLADLDCMQQTLAAARLASAIDALEADHSTPPQS